MLLKENRAVLLTPTLQNFKTLTKQYKKWREIE